MLPPKWRKILAPILLSLVLLVSACSAPTTSPYDQVQEDTTGRNAPAAVADDAVKGGSFNAFFPRSQDGFDVVPAQEKQGFAEYKLNRDGTTVAMLSINDTSGNPDAAQKFQASTRQVGGYPAVDVGSTQTAILVANRFQVKVQSRDPAFAVSDREAWLTKFNLSGLAQVK
ncbi:MAG TPA: hypothetical protein V6C88_04895 [Chroococcidiopsis sp.]